LLSTAAAPTSPLSVGGDQALTTGGQLVARGGHRSKRSPTPPASRRSGIGQRPTAPRDYETVVKGRYRAARRDPRGRLCRGVTVHVSAVARSYWSDQYMRRRARPASLRSRSATERRSARSSVKGPQAMPAGGHESPPAVWLVRVSALSRWSRLTGCRGGFCGRVRCQHSFDVATLPTAPSIGLGPSFPRAPWCSWSRRRFRASRRLWIRMASRSRRVRRTRPPRSHSHRTGRSGRRRC
jgi:hypothetical protein